MNTKPYTTEEYDRACSKNEDVYVPACGGTEKPFITRTGRKLQYCYNPCLNDHAYVDCMSDLILSQEDAEAAFGDS
jgi:hypothetical protein